MCRKCAGSPFLEAAGFPEGVPHQVTHALVMRMHRIIDRDVELYTAAELPALHAELTGEAMWQASGYDPTEGLPPESEGVDLDPEPASHDQPFLFTLAELQEIAKPDPPLPRPPLSQEEKARIRVEIELAEQRSVSIGQQLCFAIMGHRERIKAAINRHIEPQIEMMLAELSRSLEPPR